MNTLYIGFMHDILEVINTVLYSNHVQWFELYKRKNRKYNFTVCLTELGSLRHVFTFVQ